MKKIKTVSGGNTFWVERGQQLHNNNICIIALGFLSLPSSLFVIETSTIIQNSTTPVFPGESFHSTKMV